MNYEPIPGQPHEVGTEAETIATIRSVLTEKPARPVRRERPASVINFENRKRIEPPPFDAAPLVQQQQQQRAKKPVQFAPLVEPEPMPASAPKTQRASRVRRPRRILRPRNVFLGLFGLYALWQPFMALFMVLSVILLGVIAFALIGEQIWRGVMLALHELAEKDPDRAVRIRRRLDDFAVRWDGFLDRFPDGSVDGFYMPDFQVLSQDEARREARLGERLEQMRREG